MAFSLKSVLVTDEVDAKCGEILEKSGIKVTFDTSLAKNKDQLISEIPKYDGLIVRSATKVTAEVIAASNLKIIGRAGTGVDNIDVPTATKKGIIVMNTPGGNTMSAAELTCTYVLALSRHIAMGTESIRAGRWDRKKLMGNEVYGKTLGIVGLGRIGKEVALRMQSFGMTTIGFDPIIPGSVSAEFNTEWMTLEEMWPKCDYITVHTPLIPQTKNMINDEVFTKCKKGVRIINCARGGIVDEDALLKALNDGRCGGAGLDVFLEEPPTNKELIGHPLVTCTPHLGASTNEAQSRVAIDIAEQFVDVLNEKSLFGAINAQAMSNALSAQTKPYVSLASALGSLAGCLLAQVNNQTQVKLTVQGESLKGAGSYMSAAVLMGLLKSQNSNGLNLVSAPAYAKDLGLKVETEYKSEAPDDLNELVTVSVQQPGGTLFRLSGIVAGVYPILISIDDAVFAQGVQLAGNLLVYRSQANPQVLGAVAGALSAGNAVNSYSTSSVVSGESWSIMQVAGPVSSLDILKLHVNYVNQIQV